MANVPLRPTDELKSFGLSLGFDTIGVCESHAKTHLEAYKNWLDRGFHGQMEYMLRHLPLKSDPNHVLEGVQSIIAVTLNYHQSVDRTEDEPHISDAIVTSTTHRGTLCEFVPLLSRQKRDIYCFGPLFAKKEVRFKCRSTP